MERALLTLIALGALHPCVAWSQTPTFLASWGIPRPAGIAFDRAGAVYVAQYANGHIRVFAPEGTVLATWGEDGQEVWSVTGPGNLAVDSLDHLFIAEWIIHNYSQSGVQEFTTGGRYLGSFGSNSGHVSPLPATFVNPSGIAVDPEGHVYVTDTGNVRTQVFTNDRTYLYQWPSQGNSIAIDSFGHAFEVEEGGVVRKYTTGGVELAHWGSVGSGPGQFLRPQGLAVDARGRVYVTDTGNNRVQVFTNDGVFLTQWGNLGEGPGQFHWPMGIGIGPDGRVYVSDSFNNRVQVFQLNFPPDCSQARPSLSELWPPDGRMVPVDILGVTDPDGDRITIAYDSITQDEPLGGEGGARDCPDARILAGRLELRAERAGQGNGRVYRVAFTASDGHGGTCQDTVTVGVPHDQGRGHVAVDDGQAFISTAGCAVPRSIDEPLGAGPGTGIGELLLHATHAHGHATVLDYMLPEAGSMRLAVYDLAGRLVATLGEGQQPAGHHQVSWDAQRQRAGVYFCRLQTARGSVSRLVLVVR